MAERSGFGLAYETTARYGNKTSTSKARPLEEYLEEADGHFPFDSGLSVATRNRSVFLSRNGYFQGKSWKVIGVCRHGRESEPYALLTKTKSDVQLAVIQYKELLSMGYVPLVATRQSADGTSNPNLRVCCNTDCSKIVLWTSNSILSYKVSESHAGKKACTKFALGARTYLEDETLLDCKFNGADTLAVLSHARPGQYIFNSYGASDLLSWENGRHKVNAKVEDLVHASLDSKTGAQALLATRKSRFFLIDAKVGLLCFRQGPSAFPLSTVSWHPNKGLVLCVTERAVYALDQALQPLRWHDKLHSKQIQLEITELFRKERRVGERPVLSWTKGDDREAVVTSEEETVVLSLSHGRGSRHGGPTSFGRAHDVILSYLETRKWAKMKSLLQVAYLTATDLTDLMALVEEVAKSKAIDDVSSWRVFSFIFSLVSQLKTPPQNQAQLEGSHPNPKDPSLDPEKARREAETSMHRIALDYLAQQKYEAAVLVGSTIKTKALNEFLYKFMMQQGEARLAKICWTNIKTIAAAAAGSARPSLPGSASAAAVDGPSLLFAPATLRALQRVASGAAA